MLHDPPQSDPTAGGPSLEEQLVAYLDGELDDETSRRIEQLLATDPKVRETLERFEGTWDLLDSLGRADVDEVFAQSTLEMVAVAAAEDVERDRAETPKRRRRQWRIATATAVVFGLAGFVSVALFWPNPNDRLLADLPVLVHLDAYRQIDDFRFLESLLANESELFDSDRLRGSTGRGGPERGGQRASPPAHAMAVRSIDLTAPPEQQRRQVAGLDPAAKAELHRALGQFSSLPDREQQRLRELAARVQSDERSASLVNVMGRYNEWLGSLSFSDRAELGHLPIDKRIEQIKKHTHDRPSFGPPAGGRRGTLPWGRRSSASSPAETDAQSVLAWIDEYVDRGAPGMLDALAPEEQRRLRKEWKASEGDAGRRREVFFEIWVRWQLENPKALPPFDDEELANLRGMLSAASREDVGKRPPDEQRRLVSAWIRGHLMFSRRGVDLAAVVGEEKLEAFFKEDLSVDDPQRMYGIPMSREQMLRNLAWRYFVSKSPDPPPDLVPAWGRHGPQRGSGPGRGMGPSGPAPAPNGRGPAPGARGSPRPPGREGPSRD